jgi:hypothetical protein
MERNEILSVAIDAVHGINGKFSAKETSEELRNAFIELNGGSTKINPKTFYRGNELFELVQELIPAIIEEGINSDTNPLFRELVEYRNIKDGDLAEFYVEDNAHFVVATAANGIQGVRRQRITGGSTVTVPTYMKIVRVYESLGRLLAGRIDFNKFVDGVAKAFKDYIADAAYEAINGITAATAGLSSTYVLTGTPSEADIVALIEHVEAATGKSAKVIGTKGALRQLTVNGTGELYKDDIYKLGYYGMFNGTPCIRMNQAHKPGTDTFALNDDKIIIIAGSEKPIKVVREGDGLLIEREADQNADLTREYVYGEQIGVGVVVAEKIGVSAV